MKSQKIGDSYRFEFGHETITPVPIELFERRAATDTDRSEKRSANQLRSMYLKTGIVSQAPGSSYLELENSKVICSVFGPKQSTSDFYSPKGKLVCEFKLATFSQKGKKRSWLPERDTQELELIIVNALEPSIQLDKFPKSIIEINILVLEADGGIVGAAITAASLALVDSGILAYDMVSCCSVAQLPNLSLNLDPTDLEESKQIGNVSVAYMPSLQEVTHVLHSGNMSVATSLEAVDLCVAGCLQIHEMMKQHFLAKSTSSNGDKAD